MTDPSDDKERPRRASGSRNAGGSRPAVPAEPVVRAPAAAQRHAETVRQRRSASGSPVTEPLHVGTPRNATAPQRRSASGSRAKGARRGTPAPLRSASGSPAREPPRAAMGTRAIRSAGRPRSAGWTCSLGVPGRRAIRGAGSLGAPACGRRSTAAPRIR